MNHFLTDEEREFIEKIKHDIIQHNNLGIGNYHLGIKFSPTVRDIVVTHVRDTFGVYTEYMSSDTIRVNYEIYRKRASIMYDTTIIYKDQVKHFEETFDEVHKDVAEYITSFVDRQAGLVSQEGFQVVKFDLTFESYDECTESFYGNIVVEIESDGYILSFDVVADFDEFGDVWIDEVRDINICYLN